MKIAFWGNFGSFNLGNECVLAATVANMRARFPAAQLLVVSREPADVLKRHGLDGTTISQHTTAPSRRQPLPLRLVRLLWLEAAEWSRAFRFVGGLDALLVTGCGILSDQNEGSLGLPYELLKWSLVAKLRGAKVAYVSVGAESISRPASRRLIRWALGLAHYRSYRDANSAQLLASCGVPSERDPIRPDLAFSLPQLLPLTDGTDRAQALAPRIALGVIDFHGAGGADNVQYQAYLERLCALIGWLSSQGYPVRVVVGDYQYDLQVASDLRRELERRQLLPPGDQYQDEPAQSFSTLLEQLQQVDFIIASRFHNLLLALAMGKPGISLSYQAKHEALMISMGLAAYCQSFDSVDVPKLTQQIQRLQQEAPNVRPQMAQQVKLNRESLEQQYEALSMLLRNARS